MLEMEQCKKQGAHSSDQTGGKTCADSLSGSLQRKMFGAGEGAALYVRPFVLLIVLFIASLAWFLSDSTEPESAALIAPSAVQTPESARLEETMGMTAAQEDAELSDPFCLLHSEEQATLAAIVAVGGGDDAGNLVVNHAAETHAEVGGAAKDAIHAHEAGEKSRPAEPRKAGEKSDVPKVRGTVASGSGTVVLFSFGEREFFLAEGEEKDGVLLQSLSEGNAVVVVGGKSYTLSLPG